MEKAGKQKEKKDGDFLVPLYFMVEAALNVYYLFRKLLAFVFILTVK